MNPKPGSAISAPSRGLQRSVDNHTSRPIGAAWSSSYLNPQHGTTLGSVPPSQQSFILHTLSAFSLCLTASLSSSRTCFLFSESLRKQILPTSLSISTLLLYLFPFWFCRSPASCPKLIIPPLHGFHPFYTLKTMPYLLFLPSLVFSTTPSQRVPSHQHFKHTEISTVF